MAAPFANASPTSKLVFEKSSFAHHKSTHERVVDTKYFTYNVSDFCAWEHAWTKVHWEWVWQQVQQSSCFQCLQNFHKI